MPLAWGFPAPLIHQVAFLSPVESSARNAALRITAPPSEGGELVPASLLEADAAILLTALESHF